MLLQSYVSFVTDCFRRECSYRLTIRASYEAWRPWCLSSPNCLSSHIIYWSITQSKWLWVVGALKVSLKCVTSTRPDWLMDYVTQFRRPDWLMEYVTQFTRPDWLMEYVAQFTRLDWLMEYVSKFTHPDWLMQYVTQFGDTLTVHCHKVGTHAQACFEKRKATLNRRVQSLCQWKSGGRPGLPIPNNRLYGLCGCQARSV